MLRQLGAGNELKLEKEIRNRQRNKLDATSKLDAIACPMHWSSVKRSDRCWCFADRLDTSRSYPLFYYEKTFESIDSIESPFHRADFYLRFIEILKIKQMDFKI